eukprot:712348-Heterocapsa_arctica.AAC.1
MDPRAGNLAVKEDRGLGPASPNLGTCEVRQIHKRDVKGLQALGDDEQPGDEAPAHGFLVIAVDEQ